MNESKAPSTIMGVLMALGPSMVWAGEFIGSGEVINATRTGAILGTGVLWSIWVVIYLKYWVGLCGARYTVVTGEGMIDSFRRVPGPRNWLVWVVLVGQAMAGICSVGALAVAGATFMATLLPLGEHSVAIWGTVITAFAFSVAWTGGFGILKNVMALFVGVIVVGVLYVALHELPPLKELLVGLFGFRVPDLPDWARQADPRLRTAWTEILPLAGWAAGGFASQVWYSYWVMGAGYGSTAGRSWGMSADEPRLKSLSSAEASNLRNWLRVVAVDATCALIIGTVVTASFLVAGAGVLRPKQLAPGGISVAMEVSRIFSDRWGHLGGLLFLAAGSAALISTQLGQMAGWPRLLADCVRNIWKRFGRLQPTRQFRLFLGLFLVTNLTITFLFGTSPVLLVKLGAIFDGLLLVPLQSLAVLWALFVGQKRLLSPEAWAVLRPRWYHAAGLLAGFLAFGYFCVFQVPIVLRDLLGF